MAAGFMTEVGSDGGSISGRVRKPGSPRKPLPDKMTAGTCGRVREKGRHCFGEPLSYFPDPRDSGATRLAPEEPQQHADEETEQEAGDDGDLDADVSPLDMEISGQSPDPTQPTLARGRPEEQSEACQRQASDDEESSDFRHRFRLSILAPLRKKRPPVHDPLADFELRGSAETA